VAKDIENPCVATCKLSGDLCVSCGRSREDIRTWRRMKRPEKMAAVQRASARLKNLQKKKGYAASGHRHAPEAGPFTGSG